MVARQGGTNGFVHVTNDAGRLSGCGVRVVRQIRLRWTFHDGRRSSRSEIVAVNALTIDKNVISAGEHLRKVCAHLRKVRPHLRKLRVHLIQTPLVHWNSVAIVVLGLYVVPIVVVVVVNTDSIDPDSVLVDDNILHVIVDAARSVVRSVVVVIIRGGLRDRVVIANRGPVRALQVIPISSGVRICSSDSIVVSGDRAVGPIHQTVVSNNVAVGSIHSVVVAANGEVGRLEGLVVCVNH